MRSILLRRFAMLLAIIGIVVASLLPAYAVVQGRGHGRGLSKKSGKFINGHDARDGRWDGRGPRPKISVWRSRHRGRHRARLIRINKRNHSRVIDDATRALAQTLRRLH